MNIGQCVSTTDGSIGVVVSLNAGVARVCYLTPAGHISYVAAAHLVDHLRPVAVPAVSRMM